MRCLFGMDGVNHARASLFYVPKGGNSDDEYEDAACMSTLLNNSERYSGKSRYAIADGATDKTSRTQVESCFSEA